LLAVFAQSRAASKLAGYTRRRSHNRVTLFTIILFFSYRAARGMISVMRVGLHRRAVVSSKGLSCLHRARAAETSGFRNHLLHHYLILHGKRSGGQRKEAPART